MSQTMCHSQDHCVTKYGLLLLRDVASNAKKYQDGKKQKSTTSVLIPEHSIIQLDSDGYRNFSIVHERKYEQPSNSILSTGEISFYDISYDMDEAITKCKCPKICPYFKKAEPVKQILRNVSGVFRSGMNAIMGQTGCGKSSLLDILAHRKDRRGLHGQILVDGLPPPDSFKYMVGYVIQKDTICETLTVQENLMFSANIRLPKEVSYTERVERVMKIISNLGLESCADTKIGTEFIRGVSGGERKRTCIGMELVLAPKIFFLDEPTTGLDATTARNVMQCLSDLSKEGRTIIFSIHQPSYSIFKLFDTITLLCQGEMYYHGQTKDLLDYFSRQSFTCESHDNPADFVINILIDAGQKVGALEKLKLAYENSSMSENIIELKRKQLAIDHFTRSTGQKSGKPVQPLWKEIYYVSERTLKNTFRNPVLLLAQLGVAITIGFLIGLVFFDLQRTIDPGVQDRLGAIFMIVATQMFSTMTELETLIKERALFVHVSFFISVDDTKTKQKKEIFIR
ncbi:unnamed protein product [Rotaria sordida]|uniref:ABC transporter domain-containing protein n=1 Tax=Rotaria sordida TaxID=392033 RepID=A0A819SEC1_9BILA|nr:unnamed protein product [Rotaria sordida]